MPVDGGLFPYQVYNDFPILKPNLRSGVGHGHHRDFYRERPEKDHLKKLRKRTKIQKASKRRNRK